MGSSENQLIQQVLSKVGNHGDNLLIEKSTELLRLLQLKSSASIAPVGDYTKAVICVHLAAVYLERDIDFEQCVKISASRKTAYLNHKRIIEKVLDINKPIGINEICIQLKLNDVAKKATELLELYKKAVEENTNEIDIIHPQYAAMAVYQTCKANNKKVSKAALIKYSNLKPQQFAMLEKSWDKNLQSVEKYQKNPKTQTASEKDSYSSKDVEKKNEKIAPKRTVNQVEDYEHWKTRILKKAKREFEMRQ